MNEERKAEAKGFLNAIGYVEGKTGKQVIAYYPRLNFIVDNINATLMLGQMMYWHGKGKETNQGWVYRSGRDWEEQTGLSPEQQRNSRKILREKGFIIEKKKGLPATIHYLLQIEVIQTAWDDFWESDIDSKPSVIRDKNGRFTSSVDG